MLGVRCGPAPQAGCFVEVGETLVQFLLEPHRRGMTLSATIMEGVGDPRYLVPEIISDFNATQLFRGGYCLMVEPEFRGLYVNQHLSLDGLAPATLAALVGDFSRRSGEWRIWYREAAGPFWPAACPG